MLDRGQVDDGVDAREFCRGSKMLRCRSYTDSRASGYNWPILLPKRGEESFRELVSRDAKDYGECVRSRS